MKKTEKQLEKFNKILIRLLENARGNSDASLIRFRNPLQMPVSEAPKKSKRKMTKKQLAILKKGREALKASRARKQEMILRK